MRDGLVKLFLGDYKARPCRLVTGFISRAGSCLPDLALARGPDALTMREN
jgi:hypothetical protein